MKTRIILLGILLFNSILIFSQDFFYQQADSIVINSRYVRLDEGTKTIKYVEFTSNAFIGQKASKAAEFLQSSLKLQDGYLFVKTQEKPDKAGFTHIKYQQYYQKIPVDKKWFTLHFKDGILLSGSGEYINCKTPIASPAVTYDQAFQAAIDHINAKKYFWEDDYSSEKYKLGKLVILYQNGKATLAYKIDIFAEEPMSRNWVYVDATSGKIIKTESRIHDVDRIGTAETMYSGIRQITTDSLNGYYRLHESGRGGGIVTLDMNMTASYSSAVDFTDSDNYWDVTTNWDNAAYDAHLGTEATYDYYYNIHGRNSYDNAGATLTSYVHANLIAMGYPDNINAFWNGSYMTYGDGDGVNYFPLTCVDIITHEITHGVTEYSADLNYYYESGAINESFSDIFGTCVEFYLNPGIANWILGDQISSTGTPIRSMEDPNSQEQPDTYHGDFWYFGSGDNGGVHYNSGVMNFWFYLLANGGSGVNDNGDSYSVSGIGIDKAAQIVYRNLTVYLTPSSQYADARFYSIQSALDLFGDCSQEVVSVTNAWYAVGVGEEYNNIVIANFRASQSFSCSCPVTIDFENLSINGSSYEWFFGDGNTSTDTVPSNTYNTPGSYDVKLITNGSTLCNTSDTMIKIDYIQISDIGGPKTPSCTPGTIVPGEYGISRFVFNTIDNTSDPSSEGYQDNSCTYITNVLEGGKYYIRINTHPSSYENVWVWLDLDSNGVFNNSNELIYTSLDKKGLHEDSLIIPAGSVYNTPIRLRVGSDMSAYTLSTACTQSMYGQYEDYSVIILENKTVPEADFISDKQKIESGSMVFFTDRSLYLPTSWEWYFPGGSPSTSTDQNPVVTYPANGVFDVTLVVTNAFGSDTIVKLGYITVSNTYIMCTDDSSTAVSGLLYDSGGPFGDYSNSQNCSFLINPNCVSSITLTFNQFELENYYDYLYVYDGSDASGTLLLSATGSSIPSPVTAYSGSMFIRFYTNYSLVNPGFEASWLASLDTIGPEPIADFNISDATPPYNVAVDFTDLTTQNPNHWIWNFGDGKHSFIQNPVHAYSTSGTKEVTLIASGCTGKDTIVKTITVQSPPVISLLPDSFDVALFTGDSTIQTLTIDNTMGSGDLSFEISVLNFMQATEVMAKVKQDVETSDHYNLKDEKLAIWEANGLDKHEYEERLKREFSNKMDIQNNYGSNIPLSIKNGTIEDFENGTWPWSPWISVYTGGSTQNSCAYEGNRGIYEPDWHYREDITIGASGDKFSVWVKPDYTDGRAYIGFGASSSGCYSFVAAKNSGQIMIQENTSYGYSNLASVSQTWNNDQWYRMEIIFTSEDAVECNLYDSDGITLLNTISYTGLSMSSYGIAIRSFDFCIDEIYSGLGTSNWLYLYDNEGIVPAGTTADIDIVFNATGLNGGDYYADIVIESNDSVNSVLNVPAHMHVTGVPLISASMDTLVFGQTFIGYPKTDSIMITNEGTDVLIIDSVRIDNALFSVIPDSISNLSIGGEMSLYVSYAPLAVQADAGVLTIFSNAKNDSVLTLVVKGEGALPPIIAVTPDSLSADLLTGDSITHTLNIDNSGGGSDLIYTCNFKNNIAIINTNNVINNSIGFHADQSRYNNASKASLHHSATQLSLNNIIGDTLGAYENFPGSSTGMIWVEEALYVVNYGTYNLQQYDLATEQVVNTFPIHSEPYGIAYDGTFLWIGDYAGNVYGYDLSGNLVGSFSTPIENFFALTWDGTCFVVTEAWEYNSDIYKINYTGSIIETYTSDYNGTASQFVWVPEHTDGNLWVNDYDYKMIRQLNLEAGTASQVSAFSFYDDSYTYSIAHDGTDLWYADWNGPLYQLDDGISEIPQWLRVEPSSDTVPAGTSLDIDVTFNATGLFGGDYYSDIMVESNDPANPAVRVPAYLHVTGVPLISTSNDSLDFGQVFTGQTEWDTLFIQNIGTDKLSIDSIITNNPLFSVSAAGNVIPPKDYLAVFVSYSPVMVQHDAGDLLIYSNAENDSVLSISLIGEAVLPPLISVTPDSLFENLYTGDTVLRILIIDNSAGGSNLNYNITLSNFAQSTKILSEYTDGINHHLNSEFDNVLPDKLIKIIKQNSERNLLGKVNSGEGHTQYAESIPASINTFSKGDSILTFDTGTDGLIMGGEMQWHSVGGGHLYCETYNFDDYIYFPTPVYVQHFEMNGLPWEGFSSTLNPGYIDVNAYNLHDTLVWSATVDLTGSIDWTTWVTVYVETGNISYLEFKAPGGAPWYNGFWPSVDNIYIGLNWLSVENRTGTVAPGTSLDIEVMINANGLEEGNYSADIVFNSNDPVSSRVKVPVLLEIFGQVPPVAFPVDDITTYTTEDPIQISTDLLFNDPNHDTLVFGFQSSNPSVIEGALGEDLLTLIQGNAGQSDITVTANDSYHTPVANSFTVYVLDNDNPIANSMSNCTLDSGVVMTITCDTIFTDPDGDAMEYTAIAANPLIANVVVVDSCISITTSNYGSTSISITANDGKGGEATTGFTLIVSNGVAVSDMVIEGIAFRIQPNPFKNTTSFVYYLEKEADIEFRLYDLSGKLRKILVKENQQIGENVVELEGESLEAGYYLVKMSVDEKEVQFRKLIKY